MSELLVVSLFFIVLHSRCWSGLTGRLKYILNKNTKYFDKTALYIMF